MVGGDIFKIFKDKEMSLTIYCMYSIYSKAHFEVSRINFMFNLPAI